MMEVTVTATPRTEKCITEGCDNYADPESCHCGPCDLKRYAPAYPSIVNLPRSQKTLFDYLSDDFVRQYDEEV